MRRLIHLSDLHFGKTDERLIEALLLDVRSLAPDFAAISGDLTQRARKSQFIDAAKFLSRLPCPYLVIPGNHDIPLYRLPERLLQPLRGYKRHIHTDPNPVYVGSDTIIAGLNTVTRWRWMEGRIRHAQAKHLRKHWGAHEPEAIRVLVMHHPPELESGGWRKIMAEKPDLVLSGHLHAASARVLSEGPLLIGAGTAISTRVRGGEANAYNVIELKKGSPSEARVTTRAWTGDKFEVLTVDQFEGSRGRWIKRPSADQDSTT